MTEPAIELDANANGGRYFIKLEDGTEAEMTYKLQDQQTMAIDHTYVPPHYRGQNIAESLLNRGIADARSSDRKIIPVCAYVAVQFRRHPEWRDLLAL